VVSLITARGWRLTALTGLVGYCLALFLAAWPSVLLPSEVMHSLKRASGYALHKVGITPGIEVFNGETAPRAVHKMTCFLIWGDRDGKGEKHVILYDDLKRCETQDIEAIRNPFQVFQMQNLARAMSYLDLGGPYNVQDGPSSPLHYFTEYYCHTPAAESNGIRYVWVQAHYIGINLDEQDSGSVMMGGRRDCRSISYQRVNLP